MSVPEKIQARWSSRWVFILAATGSAVGLGNIWKFPYMAGKNGGGVFVLVYLACIALVGLPILMTEIMIGRKGRGSPVNAVRKLIRESGASRAWEFIGWSGMLAGALILSYYSVIAGWTMAYTVKTVTGQLAGLPPDQVSGQFEAFVSDPKQVLVWHTAFMLMTSGVLARGLEHGLEKAVKFLMPSLLLLMLGLLSYAITNADFSAGVNFLFAPDFEKAIEPGVLVSAIGHAFFTLSIAMGAMMIYGAYLPDQTPIFGAAAIVVVADTLVALCAGLIIFPIVFANGLEPAEGPGLIFQTLPTAFAQMPGGVFWGTLFFVLLLLAAWTSAISLLEPAVSWALERFHLGRSMTSWLLGGVVWLVGVLTVMSFSDWAFEFSFLGITKENGIFDMIDILTSIIMLPVGGILIALFAGWVLKREMIEELLGLPHDSLYRIWRVAVRYVAPVGVAIVMITSLFA